MRIVTRFLAQSCAAIVLGLFGSLTAFAQDYTVTNQTGQWVTPPSTGTTNLLTNITNKDDGLYTITNLPFSIPYFGVNVTSISACTNGYCFMNASGQHATAYSPTSYPYPQTTTGTSGRDGIVAVAWQDLDGRGTNAQMISWTDGTFPNRRFIIAWLNWQHFSATGSMPGFQVQFYETGRIQMAYLSASSWVGSTAGGAWNYQTGVGIDALTPDTRWVTPNGTSTYNFSSNPPNDFRFEPKITTFSGTVLMDRYVVNASGIGNVKELGQPASGLTIELRDNTNKVTGTGVTNSSGAFSLKGVALVGTTVGSLWITGQTPFCAVRGITGGASAGVQIASNVAFNADKDVGTMTINETNDPGGTNRAALNIASTVQGTYDWAASRTAKGISFLEILYDTSSAPTSYTKPGAAAAQMRIAGGSGNPDGWDRSVIRRTYARHVLGSVSGFPAGGFDNTYDGVSSDDNAFAEGFGYYLHHAVSGEASPFYDGLSSSSSNVIDTEEPVTPLSSPRGANVAAWNALGLYDLTDAANEAWDLYDGTSNKDRPFLTVATLTTAPTATTFFERWATLGYDATSLSTGFIRHGLLLDDSDEPNDSSPTARALTQFGFIRQTRVLNMFNEDWYSFIMPQPTNRLQCNVAFDRSIYNTQIVCELYNAAGAVVATAAPLSPTGAFQANTGALAAGTYRVRIKHNGGVRLPNYEVAAFSELAFSAADLAPWTVGRPINLPVNIKGGIPPYSLSVEAPFVKPPGLILDGVNAKVTGVPSQEGLFNFVLSASDAANPKNFASGPQSFRVNPVLELQFAEFMGLTQDKGVDTRAAYVGGTAPYTTTIDDGTLPEGIIVDPLDIRFTGVTAAGGSYPLTLTSTDVAGSTATQSVTAVVCSAPDSTVDLAPGRAACGYWFDAVKGSVVKVSVKTASKMPKRPLRVQMLATDGVTALDANTNGGKGRASVNGFVAPSTGRFFVIVASDQGDATQLVAAIKVTPTKKGSGKNPDQNFVAGKQFRVEFGALEGAKLTFVAKPSRGSGLSLKPIYLIDPAGEIRLLDPETEFRKSKGTLTVNRTLDMSGTWTMIVGADPGPQGSFSYSYKIVEPKGVAYSAE